MITASSRGRGFFLALMLVCLAPLMSLAADTGAAITSTAAPAEAEEPTPAEVLAAVRKDLAEGRVKEADQALKPLLRRHPDDAEALSQMVDLDLLLHRGALAEPNLKKAIAAGLPSDQAQARLAEAYLQQRQPRMALERVTVPKDDPTLAAGVLSAQARAKLQLGDRAGAIQILDRALTLAPASPSALTAKGLLALSEGDRGLARQVLGPVAAGDSGHQALAILAQMDQQDGHLEQAEKGYTDVLRAAPGQWLYRYNRALARIDLGWLVPAGEDLTAVQALLATGADPGRGNGPVPPREALIDGVFRARHGYLAPFNVAAKPEDVGGTQGEFTPTRHSMKTHAMVLAALAITLTQGCSDEPKPGPGPAEKAGAQIDQAVESASAKTQAALDKAGQKSQAALEKAGNYTGEKLNEAGKAIEHAGEQLKK